MPTRLTSRVSFREKLSPSSLNSNLHFLGFAPIEFYIDFGRHVDAFHSFLKPIYGIRPNLMVRKFSFVTKLLFRNGNVVDGVKYERHASIL